MYTNISVDLSMKILSKRWMDSELYTALDEKVFFEALPLCLNTRNSYITCGNIFCCIYQITGLVMGSSLSVAFFYYHYVIIMRSRGRFNNPIRLPDVNYLLNSVIFILRILRRFILHCYF